MSFFIFGKLQNIILALLYSFMFCGQIIPFVIFWLFKMYLRFVFCPQISLIMVKASCALENHVYSAAVVRSALKILIRSTCSRISSSCSSYIVTHFCLLDIRPWPSPIFRMIPRRSPWKAVLSRVQPLLYSQAPRYHNILCSPALGL